VKNKDSLAFAANTMPLPFDAGSLYVFKTTKIYVQWFTAYDKRDFITWEQFGIEWIWSAKLLVFPSLLKKAELKLNAKNMLRRQSSVPRFLEKVPMVLPGHFGLSEVQNLERYLGYFAVNWQLGYESKRCGVLIFRSFDNNKSTSGHTKVVEG